MAGDIKPTTDASRSLVGTRSSAKPQGAPAAGGGAPQRAADAGAGSGADQVDLTSQAQRFMELEGQLAASPAVNAARVAEIRDALADGSYQVDSGVVADKMLELSRQARSGER